MKKTPNLMLHVLEKAFYEPRTYDEIVSDGAAMERLLKSDDFKRYQKILMEAYLVLVKRIGLTQREDLPSIQGALSQHDVILGIPEKVLRKATQVVDQKREEVK